MFYDANLPNLENIRGFDLNLLLVFEAVFVYSSVKKAAETMNLSGSSISQSLSKLRTHFSDPLFVREGQKIIPTTVAINLHNQISYSFGDLLEKLTNFSNKQVKGKITVYASPYLAFRMLPDICAAIEKSGIDCEFEHISADSAINSGVDMLIYRKADIVLDTYPYLNLSITTKHCASDVAVAACRKDHPRIGDILKAESMSSESTTFLKVNTEGLKTMQKSIFDKYVFRQCSFSGSSIFVNAAVSAKSDVISFLPKWFVERFGAAMGLKSVQTDFSIEPIDLFINYNKSSMNNEGFSRIIKIIESLYQANES